MRSLPKASLGEGRMPGTAYGLLYDVLGRFILYPKYMEVFWAFQLLPSYFLIPILILSLLFFHSYSFTLALSLLLFHSCSFILVLSFLFFHSCSFILVPKSLLLLVLSFFFTSQDGECLIPAAQVFHITFREYAKLLRPLVGLIKSGKSITYFFQILSKKQFGWSEAEPHIRCYRKFSILMVGKKRSTRMYFSSWFYFSIIGIWI